MSEPTHLPPLITPKVMKPNAWMKRLSPPVKARVMTRVIESGYDDYDHWVVDLLTTASNPPQGFLLRFGSLKAMQKKAITEESVADADLFNPPGGGHGK